MPLEPAKPALGRSAVLGLAISAAVAASGCGASYASIHDSDVRFEHCALLDEDDRIPADQRRACWQDWGGRWTYGQSREKIEYAASRARALAAIERGEPEPAPRSRLRAVVAPASALVSPPPTLKPAAGPR